jgi:ribosome-associated heat shock protein Hsp15
MNDPRPTGTRDAPIRIDKLLWFLRLVPSRSLAQALVMDGHIRINSQRIVKPATMVGVGDIITLPLRTRVLVLEVLGIPHRRGPAAEAQLCYRAIVSASATDSQDHALP